MLNKPQKNHITRDLFVGLIVGFSSFVIWTFKRMTPKERKKKIQSVEKLAHHSFNKVTDFFIPHERNGYKPHIFHHRSVRNVLVATLLIKIAIVSLLFAVYPNQAFFSSNVKEEMYTLINEYRISRNEAPLAVNTYLEQVAGKKGADMIANNYFSHFGPDGKKPWQWIDKSVYDYTAMGENLAMDFLTANAVLHAFQQSPSHDKNLLLPNYSEVGISVLSGSIEGHETNLMVVYFGNPKATQLVKAAQAASVVAQPTPAPAPAPKNTNTNVNKNLNISKNTNVVANTNQVAKPANTNTAPKPVNTNTQPKPVNTNQVTQPAPVVTNTNQPSVQPEKPTELTAAPVQPEPQPFENQLAVRPGGNQTEILGVAVNTDPDSNEPSLYLGSLADTAAAHSNGDIVQILNAWSGRFFGVLLVAILIIFLINIFVKIRVQHAPVIVNALLLIIVELALFAINFHKAEAMGEQIRVLAQWLL